MTVRTRPVIAELDVSIPVAASLPLKNRPTEKHAGDREGYRKSSETEEAHMLSLSCAESSSMPDVTVHYLCLIVVLRPLGRPQG